MTQSPNDAGESGLSSSPVPAVANPCAGCDPKADREAAVCKATDRLFALAGVTKANPAYTDRRRRVEGWLRLLFDPSDQDHPHNMTPVPDAVLRDRLASANRALAKVQSYLVGSSSPTEDTAPDAMPRSIDGRIVALNAAGALRLSAALFRAQEELSTLIRKAGRLNPGRRNHKGRPVNIKEAYMVLRLVMCWQEASGTRPGITAISEKGDSGPFATWVYETWPAIYSGKQFATARAFGAGPTKLRDTLVYLRDAELIPE